MVKKQAKFEDCQLLIEGQQVMQDWEQPYMEAMAEVVTRTQGEILEVGFGMGISASYIQAFTPKSYTVIDVNEGVKSQFESWQKKLQGVDTRLVLGKWQDIIDQLGLFDGFLSSFSNKIESVSRRLQKTPVRAIFIGYLQHCRPLVHTQ